LKVEDTNCQYVYVCKGIPGNMKVMHKGLDAEGQEVFLRLGWLKDKGGEVQ
jgi:hypothetical protein